MSISLSATVKRYRSAADGPCGGSVSDSSGGRSRVLDLEDLRLMEPSRGILATLPSISLSYGTITAGRSSSLSWLLA